MKNKIEMPQYISLHKSTKKMQPLPPETKWPKEWRTVVYKTYPRLRKIQLPEPIDVRRDLLEVIRKRESRRNFASHITLEELSTLLKYSCGIVRETKHKKSRAYASAGARYPLETYILTAVGNNELDSGIYHYNVKEHSISLINKTIFSGDMLDELFLVKNASKASVFVITTAVFQRTINKYGNRGYRFILLEAGEINQNLSLIAEAISLSCCSVGALGDSDAKLDEMLDIDGTTESFIHAASIGRSVDKSLDLSS